MSLILPTALSVEKNYEPDLRFLAIVVYASRAYHSTRLVGRTLDALVYLKMMKDNAMKFKIKYFFRYFKKTKLNTGMLTIKVGNPFSWCEYDIPFPITDDRMAEFRGSDGKWHKWDRLAFKRLGYPDLNNQ